MALAASPPEVAAVIDGARRRFTPATTAVVVGAAGAAGAAGAGALAVSSASAAVAAAAATSQSSTALPSATLASQGGSGDTPPCGTTGDRHTGANDANEDGAAGSASGTRVAGCPSSARTAGCGGGAAHRRSRANALVALAAHRGCGGGSVDADDDDMVMALVVCWHNVRGSQTDGGQLPRQLPLACVHQNWQILRVCVPTNCAPRNDDVWV